MTRPTNLANALRAIDTARSELRRAADLLDADLDVGPLLALSVADGDLRGIAAALTPRDALAAAIRSASPAARSRIAAFAAHVRDGVEPREAARMARDGR